MVGDRRPTAVADPERVAATVRAVPAAAEAEDGLRRLIVMTTKAVGVEVGFVSLVDDRQERFKALSGVPEQWAALEFLPVEDAICRYLIGSGESILIEDTSEHPWTRSHETLQALGVRSYASVPVTSETGLILGGFCVGGTAPRAWTEDDARMLADVASAVSTELRLRVALNELAAARDEERRVGAEQAALRRIATAVARGDAGQAVHQRVAEELRSLLAAEQVAVVRFLTGGRVEITAGAPTSPLVDLSVCAAVLAEARAGRPGVDDEGSHPPSAVPVRVDGSVWGAVIAVTARADRERALCQLADVADLVALAIANAEARERLVELTKTDPLTGAANRRSLEERLQQELERARRHGKPVTLAVLDIDHFKQLNDAHGHAAGDRVLQEFTGRVESQLRPGDLLARLGGDEFALLLPETGYGAAAAVVGRIRSVVEEVALAGHPVTVTIGATVTGDGAVGPDELYRAADGALYTAKANGRNGVLLDQLP